MKKLTILALSSASFVSSQEAHAGNVIAGVNIANNGGTLSKAFNMKKFDYRQTMV
jgi:hypothetical protein